MGLIKNILKIFGNEKQPESQEHFGDYLKQITPTPKELKKQRQIEERQRELEYVSRETVRFDAIVEMIKREAIVAAKYGKRELCGVVTDRGFHTYHSVADLPAIKANYDNDFGTSFYTNAVATKLRIILEQKLNAIGIKNTVSMQPRRSEHIESSSYIICVRITW